MIDLNLLRCQSYQEFCWKLQKVNINLEKGNVGAEQLCKISEFIENNKELFLGNPGTAILLDSIGVKVSQANVKDPLISHLQKHIRQLLPLDPEHVKISLQFFRKTILDPSERMQAIADWISLMKIPLASFDLSEEELVGLLERLEHVDLTHYDFESHDLILLMQVLLQPNVKFKTNDAVALGTLARLCAKQNIFGTAQCIKKFRMTDPKIRTEIARLCIEAGNLGVMVVTDMIKNFEIVDETDLIEIARLCARKDARRTAKKFKNFAIKNPEARAEIARLCTNKDCASTAEHIKNFEIVDPAIRIDIVRQCIDNDWWGVAEYIENFEITDPADRAEIAHLSAEQHAWNTARLFKNFGIEDPNVRVEIACLCAEKDSRAMIEFINNFEITDPAARAKIAHLCARRAARGTAQWIESFNIENETLRFELARICANKDPSSAAEYINNFRIEDPAFRAEIACLCATKNGDATAQLIENFDIEDPTIRAEIARLCAHEDGLNTAIYIKNFKIYTSDARATIARICIKQNLSTVKLIKNFEIEDPSVRAAIAFQCAEENPYETAQYINQFEIMDPVMLERIACFCAKRKGSATAEFIKNFGITDPVVLERIARLCAKQDGGIAEFIKNFGIEDPVVLQEIAFLCVKQNAWITALHIKNFEIADPEIRIKIATLCAENSNSHSHTAEYIDNFEITNPVVLLQIARLCAKQNGGNTAEFIKNFKIADTVILQELARLCARNDGRGTAFYIKNFEIANPDLRAEIALLCAQQSGRGAAYNIKKFEISDGGVRVKIARLCALQNGHATAQFIKNFEIEDVALRTEIACLCAGHSGLGTATLIKNFEIDEEDMRVRIACLCAKQSGSTATYIQYFEIKSLEARIEIAHICAKQNGRATAEFIKNFQIKDPSIRFEIARLCAENSGSGTAQFIKNFEISQKEELELFYLCALSDPESLFCIENFSEILCELNRVLELIKILKSEEANESLREELFYEIDQLIQNLPLPENCQQTLMRTSKEVRVLPPHAQNVIGLWLVASLLGMRSLKNNQVIWMIESGIWRELALLRDPQLRILLSPSLYALSTDEDFRKPWEPFLASVRGKEGKKSLMLLMIPFFALRKGGIKEERLIKVAITLSKYRKDKTSSFRSVYHIKNLLHTMQTLATKNAYSEMMKEGFEKIFNSSEEGTIIKNMIAAKGLLHLKDIVWPTRYEPLSILFRHSLEKIIPLQDCKEDISQKYEKIFGSSLNSSGLLTYAAGLKTLEEPEVMISLGKYVTSVLVGTFKEMRYETGCNPHLTKIFGYNAGLLKTWKEDLSFDLKFLTSSRSSQLAFDPEGWLKRKLVTDRHLGNTTLTFVNRYLDNHSNRENVLQELLDQIHLTRKEKEKTELRNDLKDNLLELKKKNPFAEQIQAKLKTALKSLIEQVSADPELALLNLEKACLNFIKIGQKADKMTLINLLKEINKALNQETLNTTLTTNDFAKDIKDLIGNFQEELKSEESLQVFFTDDPIDLLLCGIGESCQRLDGNSSLNKGLLGYLVDGKNRILVIKKGNNMIARCMLRLLWDGEKPVLYRDLFYPKKLPANHQVALNVLAKSVAAKLNVPLTSNDGGINYEKDLEALGGPAPYEYSDGAGGLQKNGVYTILGAKILV